MSYCRFGDNSDVYIIHSIYGVLECFCGDPNTHKENFRSKMIEHLREHERNGDKVPSHPIDRLTREIIEKGDLVT